MRSAVAAVTAGEVLILSGVAWWSVPAAMVLAGVQLVALGALHDHGSGT